MASAAALGRGHLARCGALAEALGATGATGSTRVALYLDPDAPPVPSGAAPVEIVREGSERSLERLTEDVARGRIDAVVVDGYRFAEAEITALARRIFTAAICDFAPAPPTACRLWHGFAAASVDTATAGDATGPAFALLPETFAVANARARRAADQLGAARRRVLVAFGAVDSANATEVALRLLKRAGARGGVDCEVSVLLPSSAPHDARISAVCAEVGAERLAPDAAPIDAYGAADLAVGAPGVSMLERAACGAPSALIEQNAAQTDAARGAEAADIALRLGAVAELDWARAEATLAALLADGERLRRMRATALRTVDGGGARRAAIWLEAGAHAWSRQTEGTRREP